MLAISPTYTSIHFKGCSGAYTCVSLWPACMKGIDANSEVTFQGSHIMALTICSTHSNTSRTHRSQVIIFPKPFKCAFSLNSKFYMLFWMDLDC